MFVNSNPRRLALSNWLFNNQIEEFSSSLKLQKFIFFYESFTKLEDEEANFSYLRAYANGPVFSDLYGDYTYRKEALVSHLEQMEVPNFINEDRAKLSGFLVKIMNEKELSDLTHEFNAWKVKEPLIGAVSNVSMYEEDYIYSDLELLATLKEMYPIELINQMDIISIADKHFLVMKKDVALLNEEQKNILINLADDESIHNPVYVSVDEDGVLLVD